MLASPVVGAVACFTLADGAVRALSGSTDKTLKLWDPLAGACLATSEAAVPLACTSSKSNLFISKKRFKRLFACGVSSSAHERG